uniref:Uncharacterized protein n=1 Tax=Brassica oleracea var. oleracea TaxID=109376 RepID=A0A0D3CDQ0_BRAOL
MVITQLRFSDFKAGRCKDTVVTDLLRFWESRNVKNLAKFWLALIGPGLENSFFAVLAGKLNFAVLAGKLNFAVLRGKTRFCGFGGKVDFAVLAGKRDFTVLAGKLDLPVLTGKLDFTVFAGKLDFAVLAEKLDFVVLVKKLKLDLARLPNASKNMCFLNITISLYDYSLSRSTSDGYDAFSREDSDQKSQKIDVVLTVLKEAFKRSISGGKKGEDSCALSMRNNEAGVQRVLEPTTSSYYRKAHNSEPTCRRIQATYRPDPRTTVS